MSEEDDDADEALIPKFSKKVMSKGFCPRIRLKKIFLMILAVTVILILYYYCTQNNEIIEAKK